MMLKYIEEKKCLTKTMKFCSVFFRIFVFRLGIIQYEKFNRLSRLKGKTTILYGYDYRSIKSPNIIYLNQLNYVKIGI